MHANSREALLAPIDRHVATEEPIKRCVRFLLRKSELRGTPSNARVLHLPRYSRLRGTPSRRVCNLPRYSRLQGTLCQLLLE